MLLFQQMIVLFITMFLGYFCAKKDVLTDHTAKAISWIVVNIANPALILSASIGENETVEENKLLLTFGLAVMIFAALIAISKVFPLLLRVGERDAAIYRVMTIFSNVGFMGFPVIDAVYGTDALMYASMFLFPYNLLIYTYGIMILQKAPGEKAKTDIKKIFNIGVIACILSLVIYFGKVSVPLFARTAITNLSNLTAPLSMMVIGQSLIHIKFRELVTDGRLLLFSLIRLLVLPVIAIMLIKLWVRDEIILGVCMVMLATPVGSMSVMLAQQYGGDYSLASKGVAITTVFSVITIPLVSFLAL